MKRLSLIVFVAFCLGLVAYADDLDDGRTALNAGRNVKALKHFDSHLRKNPNDPAGYFARAEAHVAMKNHMKALDDYSTAITMNPLSAESFYGRARVYETQGQFSKALDDIDQAIFLKPTGNLLARCYVLRGHLYERSGRSFQPDLLIDAFTDYQSAVASDPKMAWAYSYRGLAKLQMHGLGGSLLQRSQSAIPLPAKLTSEQIIKEALADLDKGVELAPRYGRVYALRAIGRLSTTTLEDKDGIQRGMDDITKAIECAPRKPDGYEIRAAYTLHTISETTVYRQANGMVVARRSFKNDTAKLQQALDDLNLAIQYGSTEPMILRSRAAILEQKQDAKTALNDYHLACQYDQENQQGWNDLAWLAATHWNPDVRNGTLAVTAGKRANSCLHCKNPYWLDTLAAAYAEAGEFTKAVETAQTALKHLRPSDQANRIAFAQRLQLYQQKKPFHMPAPMK